MDPVHLNAVQVVEGVLPVESSHCPNVLYGLHGNLPCFLKVLLVALGEPSHCFDLKGASSHHYGHKSDDDEGEAPREGKGNGHREEEAEDNLKQHTQTGPCGPLDLGCVTGQSGGEGTSGVELVIKPAHLLTQHGLEGPFPQTSSQILTR